jgi:phosphohistidine phosphatase SixA
MKFSLGLLLLAAVAQAQTLSGEALVKALRQGGYVILMRHASSPREVPANQTERVLDETGRTTATAMGKALRDLKIPVGEVLTSPTYRARETVRLAQFANAKPAEELGEGGQNMSGGTEAQADWLRKKVTQLPAGTNTILVTHLPNISRAFPQQGAGLADGEALIFGRGGLVGRVKIEEWPALASASNR